jgi:adenine-specific DNA methylase
MSRSPFIPYFRALPPYLGSKQKLVPWIFNRLARVIPQTEWKTLSFLDAFVGGGSMSMAAKVLGFKEIHSNDWSARSQLVIRGLLKNQSYRLTVEDKLQLVSNSTLQAEAGFTQANFCPFVFSTRHAQALDRYLRDSLKSVI